MVSQPMVNQPVNQSQPSLSPDISPDISIDQAGAASRRTLDAAPNSYAVDAYCDEVLITCDDLLYGTHAYPLQNIISMQIIRLRQKGAGLTSKPRHFVGLAAIAAGLILALSPLALAVRLLGLFIAVASAVYLLMSYLKVGEQKNGEYGLLVEMKLGIRRVLTSHSLRAIQRLYHLLFDRLQQYNPTAETLIVNMYTGEVSRESDQLI
ncbi:MAG: DUF6232 family protein [Cyanobacteria bacterium P01_A01_bin.114]